MRGDGGGMSIASLIDPITAKGGTTRFDNLDHWLQGRTL